MSDELNPYQQWLGLPATPVAPDHYTLLGLERYTADPAQIRRATDLRKSQVRGCRPGAHAAAWGKLLDEIDAAGHCLTNPEQRAAYDAELKSRPDDRGATAEPEPPATVLELSPVRNLMPPGWSMGAGSSASSSPAPLPAAEVSPSSLQPAPIQPAEIAEAPVAISAASVTAAASVAEPVSQPAAIVPSFGATPATQAPILQNLGEAFVIPTILPTGPAAQLLPPPVMTASLQQAMAGAATPFPVGFGSIPAAVPIQPVAPQPAAFAVPLAAVPIAAPATAAPEPMDVAAVDVEPQPASHSQPSGKPTARSTASATPVSPAAIGGIVGIGLGIVILVFAILSLWRRQSATETASNSGGTIASAAGKDPHPSVPPPAQSEKPTPPPEQPSPAPENPFDPGSPESPVTPPSTDPPPKNPPPKNPKPPVSPPTPPMPAPPAAPTPEQTEKVRAILLRARQSLADRDPAAATAAVKEAEQLAGEGPLQDAIAPTADLAHYVGEFWRAVHAALPKLGGSEIELGDTVVYVVEAGPDRLVIRMAGQNREYTPQKLPSGLARRIAENWLDKSAATKVIIGAFLAVDPTMQQSSGKEKARGLWKEAARQGADVKELLRVLDEPDK